MRYELDRPAIDPAKQVGMRRWIDAVNHWGRLGRWRFEKLHSTHDLDRVL